MMTLFVICELTALFFFVWAIFTTKPWRWLAYLLIFLVPMAIVPAMIFVNFKYQTHDVEYWGGFVQKVEFYEEWNEYVKKTCSDQDLVGFDDEGNGIYVTTYYDCSYIDFHPARYIATDNNGIRYNVTKSFYDHHVIVTGQKPKKIDLGRHYHTIDGDKFVLTMPIEGGKAIPIFSEHVYENRAQASTMFPRVENNTKDQYDLFDYPHYLKNHPTRFPTILDQKSKGIFKDYEGEFDQEQWRYLNAELGKPYQIRIWVLLFRNQPKEAAQYQEYYWAGGNKNELVICIGVNDDDMVLWCQPFCWSPNDHIGNNILKDNISRHVAPAETKELNLSELSGYVKGQVKKNWKRKPFAELNNIEIKPSVWVCVGTSIINTIMCGLMFGLISSWFFPREY